MAQRRDQDGPLDDFGNIRDPFDDQGYEAPAAPNYDDGMGGTIGFTDPSVRAPDPSQPPPSPQPTGTGGAPSGNYDDNAILAQVGQWAQMPGADPSLSADPQYWLRAIKSRDGLNAGNLQYWQDASVGPSAFFNNPNREGGAPGGAQAPAPSAGGSSGGGGGLDLRALLTQLLMGRPDNGSTAIRNANQARLSAMMDDYGRPVTADDPLIHNASDAYQGDIQRSIASFREQAAERAHAQGVGTGAFDAQIGNAVQAGGRAAGKFTTDLIGQETNTRRSLLAQALGQSSSLADSADNADLRNRSLDLSSILGQEGVDNQEQSISNDDNHFYDNLASTQASHANDLDTILQELLLS